METKIRKYVSWGYRCTSSEMWKRLGKKEESYPFDWMISRLPVIQYHIETDFANYMVQHNEDTNEYNYKEAKTQTAWYDEGGNANVICYETVQYHTAFSFSDIEKRHYSKDWVYGRDTYSYPMAFNHRNVFEMENQAYFERCVGRWRELRDNSNAIMIGLYIHPILTANEYDEYRVKLLEDYRQFMDFMRRTHVCEIKGIFIIPIRTQVAYPITQVYSFPLDLIVNEPDMKILELRMNEDAVDAGSAFYRNAYIEEEVLEKYLLFE